MNKIIRGACICVLISIFSCDTQQYSQGERVYNKLCANCHMEDGSGLNKLIPSLDSSLHTFNIAQQVCIIKNGFNADSLGIAMNVMPSFDKIKIAELVNLVNYINYKWHPQFKEQNLQTIKANFDDCGK